MHTTISRFTARLLLALVVARTLARMVTALHDVTRLRSLERTRPASNHDWSGAQTLVLTTGAGQHATCLIYGRYGTAYVVAAIGDESDEPPVWLRDLERDSRGEIEVLGGCFEVRARAPSSEEVPPLWRMMTRYLHEARCRPGGSRNVSAVVLLEPSDASLWI